MTTTSNSKILCHQVFYTARHISIQCTKQFMLHLKTCPGLGGVDLIDDGGGWYTMYPRTELLTGKSSSTVDRALFLEFARDDLEAFITKMEAREMTAPRVTVVPSETKNPGSLVNSGGKVFYLRGRSTANTKYTMTVAAPVSSAMKLEQWATEKDVGKLARHFAADRHPTGRGKDRVH